ncbi:MAG: XRE family transcriptional regulator [Tannerella sp.]|jgi:transcriptional regulator with XRE-family HTH domain|nr:XRE family transcriptional regulator [Tannerella sp.]
MKEKVTYKDLKDIHIGLLIKQKFEETGMSAIEFARRIHCARNSIYYTFKQKSIDIEKLELISKVLKYDFLRKVYL